MVGRCFFDFLLKWVPFQVSFVHFQGDISLWMDPWILPMPSGSIHSNSKIDRWSTVGSTQTAYSCADGVQVGIRAWIFVECLSG